MKDESFGIIPVHKINKEWEVLLVQHRLGHWTFPKGHSEPGETFHQAAERELVEETGLIVTRYLSEQPFCEEYNFLSQTGESIQKKVLYFIAEVTGQIQLQVAEVVQYQWVPLAGAIEVMTFREGKKLCSQVVQWMSSNL